MRKRAGALTLALFVVAALVAACGGSAAVPSGAGGFITFKDQWVRTAPADGTSAAYFTVTNGQLTADELTGASSPVAMSVGVHETTTDASGMMGMHQVAGVTIPAGGSVEFKPGSYHIMLMGLKQELKAGDQVELQITFKNSGTVRLVAGVREP